MHGYSRGPTRQRAFSGVNGRPRGQIQGRRSARPTVGYQRYGVLLDQAGQAAILRSLTPRERGGFGFRGPGCEVRIVDRELAAQLLTREAAGVPLVLDVDTRSSQIRLSKSRNPSWFPVWVVTTGGQANRYRPARRIPLQSHGKPARQLLLVEPKLDMKFAIEGETFRTACAPDGAHLPFRIVAVTE